MAVLDRCVTAGGSRLGAAIPSRLASGCAIFRIVPGFLCQGGDVMHHPQVRSLISSHPISSHLISSHRQGGHPQYSPSFNPPCLLAGLLGRTYLLTLHPPQNFGGRSIYGPAFDDEGFKVKHKGQGALA
jgi:hypothetical protein